MDGEKLCYERENRQIRVKEEFSKRKKSKYDQNCHKALRQDFFLFLVLFSFFCDAPVYRSDRIWILVELISLLGSESEVVNFESPEFYAVYQICLQPMRSSQVMPPLICRFLFLSHVGCGFARFPSFNSSSQAGRSFKNCSSTLCQVGTCNLSNPHLFTQSCEFLLQSYENL